MSTIYITAHDYGVTAKIAEELVGDGLPTERIRIFSTDPGQAPPMPVPVIRYRSPANVMRVGGLIGALLGALFGLPILWLGSTGYAPYLVVVVLGGLAGALLQLWLGRNAGDDLYELDDALRRGERVMALEVEKGHTDEWEERVKRRHPEVSVLGKDPHGHPAP